MPFTIPEPAIAYMNMGRWGADCPAGCNSAMKIERGQETFACGWPNDKGIWVGGCGATADIQWPAEVEVIDDALTQRPEPHRNWAPAGHRQTYVERTRDGQPVADVYPDGQTAADLLDEARK